MPGDLAAIMRHARARDAQYFLFDTDAQADAALPTFDWSP